MMSDDEESLLSLVGAQTCEDLHLLVASSSTEEPSINQQNKHHAYIMQQPLYQHLISDEKVVIFLHSL